MITHQELEAIQVGDVVYAKNRRRTFLGWKMVPVYATFVSHCEMVRMMVCISKSQHVYHYRPSEIDKIVPKDKTKKYASRRIKNFVESTGGRTEQYAHENNDCTVRALANACEVSYQEAHDYMRSHGRKDKKGANSITAYANALIGKYKVSALPISYPIKTVAQTFKAGLPPRCIVRVNRHVFAVVNGKVLDTFRVGSCMKVYRVFVVEEVSCPSSICNS